MLLDLARSFWRFGRLFFRAFRDAVDAALGHQAAQERTAEGGELRGHRTNVGFIYADGYGAEANQAQSRDFQDLRIWQGHARIVKARTRCIAKQHFGADTRKQGASNVLCAGLSRREKAGELEPGRGRPVCASWQSRRADRPKRSLSHQSHRCQYRNRSCRVPSRSGWRWDENTG